MKKQNRNWICHLIVMGLVITLTNSCKKDKGDSTVTDIDGNVYHTVNIGGEFWMVENLKTSKYNDGTIIPNITDDTAWGALTTPAYCWYNNDSSPNKNTYGALYNWYTISSSNTHRLCPDGWMVSQDWANLDLFLITNGYNYDGSKSGNKYAKSLASITGWTSSINEGAVGNTDYPDKRNSTGFTALPGGYRTSEGSFFNLGENGYWWDTEDVYTVCQDSSYMCSTIYALGHSLYYNDEFMIRSNYNKGCGFSVRCVRMPGVIDYDP